MPLLLTFKSSIERRVSLNSSKSSTYTQQESKRLLNRIDISMLLTDIQEREAIVVSGERSTRHAAVVFKRILRSPSLISDTRPHNTAVGIIYDHRVCVSMAASVQSTRPTLDATVQYKWWQTFFFIFLLLLSFCLALSLLPLCSSSSSSFDKTRRCCCAHSLD